MLRYFVQRFIFMIITLLLVSVIIFIVIELPPGDYAERYAYRKLSTAGLTVTEEDMESIRHEFGLDKPAPVRYFNWISDIVLHGDFGESFLFHVPVANVVGSRIWLTMALALTAIVLTYALAIPIGIFSALYRHSFGDYLATFIGYIGLSLPNFMLALVLLYFSVTVLDSSAGGLFSAEFEEAAWSWAKFVDLFKHLWVPAVVLGTANTAFHLQTMRATMLDELNQLYVDAARARGISEWKVIFKYPVRIALNPIISYLGFDLGRLVAGAPVVALVLSLPDAGQLLLNALLQQDMFLGGAILLMISAMIVIGVFISDLMLAALDPRIRLGET
ncbi:MAG: ABC transporter permease [Anaerolineales bacterium]|nr:ABC transporter permease [Anaerolineales bacterium]